MILADDWMQVLLITDADVIFEPDSLRQLTRHLADDQVGAVTAYIKEGSRPGNYLTRFIGYEYVTAQAAARRAQNVLGTIACLAGGAQLHTRANLVALGGRIDTSSLAEDTITTFQTQLAGRRVVFEPHATVWAEEPGAIGGLWKQRLRWARGNVQVTRRYRRLWFRPARGHGAHGLGGVSFGLFWFCLFLQPVFMITSSAALLTLYFTGFPRVWLAFHVLWIINAATYVFITCFSLLIDPATGRRCWRQAIFFPGAVNLVIIVYSCFPRLFTRRGAPGRPRAWAGRSGRGAPGWLIVFIYAWLTLSMAVAYLAKVVEPHRFGRVLSPVLIYLVGYGSVLCACTFASYVLELRRAEARWDKTEKTGQVKVTDVSEFRREIRAAMRYERGLAVKGLAALAVVAVIVVLRTLYFRVTPCDSYLGGHRGVEDRVALASVRGGRDRAGADRRRAGPGADRGGRDPEQRRAAGPAPDPGGRRHRQPAQPVRRGSGPGCAGT